jgi:hypothetical protein
MKMFFSIVPCLSHETLAVTRVLFDCVLKIFWGLETDTPIFRILSVCLSMSFFRPSSLSFSLYLHLYVYLSPNVSISIYFNVSISSFSLSPLALPPLSVPLSLPLLSLPSPLSLPRSLYVSGLYYKRVTIVIDAPSVVSK